MARSIRPRRAPHLTAPARTRNVLATCVSVGVALALSACSTTNPMTTTDSYAAADGVDVELGDLRIGNLLVLASAQDAAGTVLAALSNDGTSDIEVTIGLADGEGTSVSVPGGQTVVIGPQGRTPVELDAVPAAPGALVALTISSDRGGSTTERVPVLDDTFPQYADLVP